MKTNNCRFCNESLNFNFVDLGISPLANSFLEKHELQKKELRYPLHAYVCGNCFLVQLEEFEKAETLFSDYLYFSSYSRTWLEHAKDYVKMIIPKLKLNSSNQVIEIASNDDYLLQFFGSKNIPVLGIEPALNIAKEAEKKNIPTITEFFGVETAKKLAKKEMFADLLIGNNVLAHVPNLNDFVEGMRIILKKSGVITLEFPHLLKLIENNQFDTIYHEHFSYFSFLTVQKILLHHNLEIFDVEEISTHGGSLRIFVKHREDKSKKISSNVDNLTKKEIKFGYDNITIYQEFQKNIDKIRDDIKIFFNNAKKKKKVIVGYGAPAKGNTLLNYCKIETKSMKFTVDLSIHKQGLFLPGTHIPIYNPKKINEEKPDYVFILPWNLKDEIMEQLQFIRKWGGKFVIPIPEVKIL